MRALIQAELRDITDQWLREEISYSRMNELINEKADQFAIEYGKWLTNGEFSELSLKLYKKIV
jgi:hypothetical protein